MIWFTSDLHLCHNRMFIYGPRGFKSIYEMNETIVKNWNSVVKPKDDVYILGDLMLNDNEAGAEFVRNLNGKLHIVFGNHDTDTRRELYKTFHNVVECADAIRFNAYDYHFF